jgi:hypothetical protein
MSNEAPGLADWLPDDTPALQAAIVRRAMTDLGITEMPLGSNRSPRIDSYVTAVGSPLGSYWCAAATSAWFRDSGAMIPVTAAGSCQSWLLWAKQNGSFRTTGAPGFAVLYDYGQNGRANHIGVVVRVSPLILTVEGNTSLDSFDRNGIAVELKKMNTPRVIGFVAPTPQVAP